MNIKNDCWAIFRLTLYDSAAWNPLLISNHKGFIYRFITGSKTLYRILAMDRTLFVFFRSFVF